MKRIVIDFDDTISIAVNRNWHDAVPNGPVVAKMRELKQQGWTIDIFTARGSISCKSRHEASRKYRMDIVNWLQRYEVPYDGLSFDKPLATYYVDDKAMLPNEFANLEIEQLVGGLSGADIYSDGKLVFKEDDNAFAVESWYGAASAYTDLNVPNVERVVGKTLTLQYIQHDNNFFHTNVYRSLGIVCETLNAMKQVVDYPKENNPDFDSYANNIISHIMTKCMGHSLNIVSQLMDIDKKGLLTKGKFYHGDFSITNMLFQGNDLFLIDPIPHKFGCPELDAAKFLASLLIFSSTDNAFGHEYDIAKSMILATLPALTGDDLNVLIGCEIIRVYKYSKDKSRIEQSFNYVFQ
jgi:capsule biosynthesis phosphatase